jgi:hypothetical protein
MRRVTSLLLPLLVIPVLAAAMLATSPVDGTDARPAAAKTWIISGNGVGPLKVSMTSRQAIATRYFKVDPRGCGVAPKGALSRALDPWFNPTGNKAFMKVYVNRASVKGYRFRTKSGVKVGTTVAKLRAKEHLHGPTGYIYEHGFTFYEGSRGHWVTFMIDTDAEKKAQIKPTDTVRSIAVSRLRILGGGGC